MLNKSDIIRIINNFNFQISDYWIAAGAAMVMHGIKQETKDIDLGCTTKLFEQFISKGYKVEITKHNRRCLHVDDELELFENWNADGIDILDGLPVINLESLKKLKLEVGRKKDLHDIVLIDEFIAKTKGDAMMKETGTAFIIHGAYGNSQENWFPWLKKMLEEKGVKVYAPDFPTPEGHTLNNWMKFFDNYISALKETSIIIGHSMAPAFILSVLEKIDFQIKAAFFVAPFIGKLGLPLDELNMTFTEKDFNWDKIKQNCKRFYIYSSDNDEYVPLEKGKELYDILKTDFNVITNAGHFNKKAGYSTFPRLLEDILLEIDRI